MCQLKCPVLTHGDGIKETLAVVGYEGTSRRILRNLPILHVPSQSPSCIPRWLTCTHMQNANVIITNKLPMYRHSEFGRSAFSIRASKDWNLDPN